jgi:hypothetical protein
MKYHLTQGLAMHHNMYVAILLLVLLQALDDALRIGVPPAAITELVGPATVGKSQFCYTLALQVRQCWCTGGVPVQSQFKSCQSCV